MRLASPAVQKTAVQQYNQRPEDVAIVHSSGYANRKATLSALEQDSMPVTKLPESQQRFQIRQKNPYLTKRTNSIFHVRTHKQGDVECLSLGGIFPGAKIYLHA